MFRSLIAAWQNGDPAYLIVGVLATTFVVFCTLPIHEFAHAWAATKLGDDTARLQGRLTLNPLAHLSLWGTVMIYLFGFGFANPVPVNPIRFKNRKRGMALTAFAGPASNLIMAFLFLILYNLVLFFFSSSETGRIVAQFINFAASININLAVFNLLPIPPLDGSRIITLVIPDKYYFEIMRYEQYIMIGVLVLLALGWLTIPLTFLSNLVYGLFDWIVSLPFGLLFA
ncbi:MAG: site-2 protease family protein [Oscillospiraceae bacterium]|jgi:Zn-dependent protease|nr:site-2 protease family protein [Oscillospiraceae bacterium]